MRYRLSSSFRDAVKASGVARYRLATRGNLSPARFCELWNHVTFGRITRERVIAIGATLGLGANACVDLVNDALTVSMQEPAR
jgi:hypothetical protein